MAFYVNESINFKLNTEIKVELESLESIWFKISINKKLFAVGVMYHHFVLIVNHLEPFKNVPKILRSLLSQKKKKKKDFYMMDDMRIDLLKVEINHNIQYYANNLVSCSVKCVINKSTSVRDIANSFRSYTMAYVEICQRVGVVCKLKARLLKVALVMGRKLYQTYIPT